MCKHKGYQQSRGVLKNISESTLGYSKQEVRFKGHLNGTIISSVAK